MLGFHERRKLKRYLFSQATLAVLGILIFLLGWSVWGVYKKERDTREKQQELVAERAMLLERSRVLASEIENLQTSRGVESELRERFEVGAPGEKLVIIVDPAATNTASVSNRSSGFWGWIKSWFVN